MGCDRNERSKELSDVFTQSVRATRAAPLSSVKPKNGVLATAGIGPSTASTVWRHLSSSPPCWVRPSTGETVELLADGSAGAADALCAPASREQRPAASKPTSTSG